MILIFGIVTVAEPGVVGVAVALGIFTASSDRTEDAVSSRSCSEDEP